MDILPDPAGMTAEERFLEIAVILARGASLGLKPAHEMPISRPLASASPRSCPSLPA